MVLLMYNRQPEAEPGLPSVGRTNANDSSMQDGVGIQTARWCGAREVLLYLACDVCRETERAPADRMHRSRASSRPSGVSADRLATLLTTSPRSDVSARNLVLPIPLAGHKFRRVTACETLGLRCTCGPFTEESRLDGARWERGRW